VEKFGKLFFYVFFAASPPAVVFLDTQLETRYQTKLLNLKQEKCLSVVFLHQLCLLRRAYGSDSEPRQISDCKQQPITRLHLLKYCSKIVPEFREAIRKHENKFLNPQLGVGPLQDD